MKGERAVIKGISCGAQYGAQPFLYACSLVRGLTDYQSQEALPQKSVQSYM